MVFIIIFSNFFVYRLCHVFAPTLSLFRARIRGRLSQAESHAALHDNVKKICFEIKILTFALFSRLAARLSEFPTMFPVFNNFPLYHRDGNTAKVLTMEVWVTFFRIASTYLEYMFGTHSPVVPKRVRFPALLTHC